mmetsp:Transcript_1411/g.4439  ORF Transcript_1411/g.4439 Transcript_1411/m.4439 type:complete len:254 (+) Transcript_1411:673-1434(+)
MKATSTPPTPGSAPSCTPFPFTSSKATSEANCSGVTTKSAMSNWQAPASTPATRTSGEKANSASCVNRPSFEMSSMHIGDATCATVVSFNPVWANARSVSTSQLSRKPDVTSNANTPLTSVTTEPTVAIVLASTRSTSTPAAGLTSPSDTHPSPAETLLVSVTTTRPRRQVRTMNAPPINCSPTRAATFTPAPKPATPSTVTSTKSLSGPLAERMSCSARIIGSSAATNTSNVPVAGRPVKVKEPSAAVVVLE